MKTWPITHILIAIVLILLVLFGIYLLYTDRKPIQTIEMPPPIVYDGAIV